MANQQGNGRNVAIPDENRPSWRPQDENGSRGRRGTIDDEDRYMSREDERMHWDERGSRWSTERYGQGQSGYGGGRYEGDRSYSSRNVSYPMGMEERARERGLDERFSQGRGGSSWGERGGWDERGERYERSVGGGGYGHGRYEPQVGYASQPDRYMGSAPRRGMYGGGHLRGGHADYDQDMYGPREQGMYGQREYERGYEQRGYDQSGGRGVQGHGGLYGQGGYNEGVYGPGGMQHRYGSEGYQGWGQQPGASWRPGMAGQPGRQSHRGKGPAGYTRSDERIREMVCEALSDDHDIDATNIEVTVKAGEVVLSGTVEDRMQKRMAEDCVEQVSGVKDVQNQLRVVSERKTSS